jgi:hypothetical protein
MAPAGRAGRIAATADIQRTSQILIKRWRITDFATWIARAVIAGHLMGERATHLTIARQLGRSAADHSTT